ncbi:MAG: acetyl-CoA C-acyltransferase [Planctomycetota bacterium]|nr:MAG: acetyl-CoA C-acyltransferase [Planctomycetota bacterium]
MLPIEIVITHALRTPIGKFLGALSPLSAVELGAHAIRSVLAESGLDGSEVDDVLMGQGRQLGSGPNPARQSAIAAGLPDTVPASTFNRACGSGLETIWMGARRLALGEAKFIIAGGMESMTNIPYLLPKMRSGYRLGHGEVLDGNFKDGFFCPLANMPMGRTAENLVDRFELSRQEQDEYALQSFQRWEAAEAAGRFASERAPIEITGRKGAVTKVDFDEHGRKGQTLEALAKLPPVFRKAEEGGTVHAGNSSGITDGGVALLLTTREIAEQRGMPIMARLGVMQMRALAPEIMGVAPVPAMQALCAKLDVKPDDFDLIELNEAFAAQVLACQRQFPLPMDRLNVNGGAIALGHPIGASGARIATTLLHEMQRRDAKLGMAALCMSGGQGMAISFHRD